MNKEFLNLGKEIVLNASKTWSTLEYLDIELIKDSILEKIGKEVYYNKNIFTDYLYYKYELVEYYKEKDIEFSGLWMAEWWYDERGNDFQKNTFHDVAQIIINNITSEEGKWYLDKSVEIFLPIGTHFSTELNTVVYDNFKDITVDNYRK